MGSYDTSGTGFLGYIDPSDVKAKDLKQMKDHYYTSWYPANGAFWQQASIDLRMKAGDQSFYQMMFGGDNYFQARRFFFNFIRRQVNMMAGYQRKNRKSTITMPINDNDSLCDDYNKVIKWSETRDGFQEYNSQSFEGGISTGFNLLHLYPDYTNDPISGDLFTDQVAYNNVLIDPYWRKMDFSDCNGIWRRRWVSKMQASSLLPGHAQEIYKMRPSGVKDGRFPLQAELLNLDTNSLFPYDEFYYKTTRTAEMVIDPYTGESIEWEKDIPEMKEAMRILLSERPWMKVKKMEVPTVKLCISMGDKQLYDGANLLNIDQYPFAPHICYHEPDMQSYAWRQQGIVRNLRDSQYLFNMRKVIEMDILQSQINSGWIYPIDVVTDPKAFRQSGQGFLVPLKAGKSPADIQRIDPPALPQSLLELSRGLADDMMKISGVNEELLGSAVDDKAGILSMLRQGAGLTTLQTIFDKADYTQRIYGAIRLQAIRKNFSRTKIRQILGHDPDPMFWSSRSLKYSIEVEEGNYSATQRQTELQQLLHFRELGVPIPNKSIIRAGFITNKEQLIQDMEEEQQQQMQAQQAQAAQDEKRQNADIMSKYAKARSDLAKEKDLLADSQEKIARIGEIEASREHKEAQADLDLVRTLVELEDMQIENFRRSLEMAEAIKIQNRTPVGVL